MFIRKITENGFYNNTGPLFWRQRRKTGGWIHLNYSASPIQEAHGQAMTLAEFRQKFNASLPWEKFVEDTFLERLISLGYSPNPKAYHQMCQPIKHGDTGVPWIRVGCSGDHTLPVEFFVYWDRIFDRFATYFPIQGNLCTKYGRALPAERVRSSTWYDIPDETWNYIFGPAWGEYPEKDWGWMRTEARKVGLQKLVVVNTVLIIQELYQGLICDERTRNN